MKFTCNQKDLNTNLTLVNRAIPAKPTHSVLSNVLLKADAETNQVSLTAFDLSLGINATFPAKVSESGVVAIPAKLLVDIISKLNDGDIYIETEELEDGVSVQLKPKTGKYNIRAMVADEYPELPEIEIGKEIHLSAKSLVNGLRGSVFATSPDESKQILTGLHLKVTSTAVEFAATDGHRLAVVETVNDTDTGNIEVTIPARSLRELEKLLSQNLDSENSVVLKLDESQVVFEWEGKKLTTRTIEGTYPQYRQLIPRQFEKIVTIDRKLFILTLDRIAVIADQRDNVVRLSLDSSTQEIVLSCEAKDAGYGTESLKASISGDDITLAFNVKYLMEGLKTINSSEIQMHINQPLTPVIFTPIGGLKMTYLAMPVQIR